MCTGDNGFLPMFTEEGFKDLRVLADMPLLKLAMLSMRSLSQITFNALVNGLANLLPQAQ